jgi:hypothetical protein
MNLQSTLGLDENDLCQTSLLPPEQNMPRKTPLGIPRFALPAASPKRIGHLPERIGHLPGLSASRRSAFLFGCQVKGKRLHNQGAGLRCVIAGEHFQFATESGALQNIKEDLDCGKPHGLFSKHQVITFAV